MLQEFSERHRSTNGWFGPDGDVEDQTALSYMIFDLVDRASHSEIYHSGLNWDWKEIVDAYDSGADVGGRRYRLTEAALGIRSSFWSARVVLVMQARTAPCYVYSELTSRTIAAATHAIQMVTRVYGIVYWNNIRRHERYANLTL